MNKGYYAGNTNILQTLVDTIFDLGKIVFNWTFEYWLDKASCNIGGTFLTVFFGCITFIAVIMMFVFIEDLVKWIVIPEMQFYEVIKSLVA